jgi:hypothetical protein
MNSVISQKKEWVQFFAVFAIGMLLCGVMMWVGSTQEYVAPVRKIWGFPAPPQLTLIQIVGLLGRFGVGLLLVALVFRCLTWKA